MLDTGLYLPIRMFEGSDLSEQSINTYYCSGVSHSEYFTYPNGYIPPFQVPEFGSIANIKLVNICTDEEYLLTDISLFSDAVSFNETGLQEKQTYKTFPGGETTANYPNGTYYITLDNKYYSDLFIVSDDPIVELKYRDEGVRQGIYWRSGFYAFAGINSIVERPTYPIEEEVHEDQKGDNHRVFQRWSKRHNIKFKGVESMADAMSLLPLMDEVYINDTRVYDVLTEVNWDEEETGGCLADIVISFETRKVFKTF